MDGLASILSNYSVLRATWDDCIVVCRDTELVARINGVSSQMNKFDFLFGLELAETVLRMSDNLSKTLQHKEYSAAEGQEISSLTVKTLESIRNESSFDMLWDKIELRRQALEVDRPVIGRKEKNLKDIAQLLIQMTILKAQNILTVNSTLKQLI